MTVNYRPLGRTGVQVSSLCLGAMNFGGPTPDDEAVAILDRAFDAGINFVDTADVYTGGRSEEVVGHWLRGSGHREEVVLATKCGIPTGSGPLDVGHSRHYVVRACERSLRRLGVDHIDLYQIHRPSFEVPQDETLGALDDLVRSGKVRLVGCSTHPAWLVMESLATSERHGLVRYVSEQSPYNLLDRRIENELIPLCRRHGLAVLPWSPIGGGILAGRYRSIDHRPEDSRATRHDAFSRRITPEALSAAEQVADLAAARGLEPAALALLWAKDQPGVTAPITGPRTLHHLETALTALEATLDDELAAALDEVVAPGTAVADFHNTVSWKRAP